MVSGVVGVVAIVFGLVGLISPRAFKNRLQRILNFRVKLIVYVFIAVFAVFILLNVLRADSVPAMIAAIIGLVITVKIIKLATAKSSETLSVWMEQRSLMFFRKIGGQVLTLDTFPISKFWRTRERVHEENRERP
jgi:nitrate reductase gamma subunit